MKKDNLRKVPMKNYIILGVILLITLCLVYYFYMWCDAYQDKTLNRPILDKYMEVINYNELDNYLIENPNTIIYVSVLEDMPIREFEKKLKKLFREDAFERDILYMDLTIELNDEKIRNKVVNKYSNNILNVPMIMVFDDGELKTIYNIKEHNYNLDELRNFINNIRFIEEDDNLG